MDNRFGFQLFGEGGVMRFCPVPKEHILSGELSVPEAIIEASVKELEMTGNIHPWSMTISGYDTDPRSLPMIPEVVAWFRKLHEAYPYFPVLLSAFSVHSYMMSQIHLEVVGSGRSANLTEDQEKHIDSAVDFFADIDPAHADEYRPQFEEDIVYAINAAELEAVISTVSMTGTMFLASKKVPAEDGKIIVEETLARIYSVFS